MRTLLLSGLVALGTYGHTMGHTDHLSVRQTRAAALVLACCAGLLVASTIKSVYLRAEDDLIGRATLPLDFLMDQKTHGTRAAHRPSIRAIRARRHAEIAATVRAAGTRCACSSRRRTEATATTSGRGRIRP